MSITATIRNEARKSGISTYMLAKKAGVRVSSVQRFVAGGGLNCETAEQLAKALGYRIVLQPIEQKAKGK